MSLTRFLDAQNGMYEVALSEIRTGRKKSHWIWFIFPQIKGLGKSSTSQQYALESLDEAKKYLSNDVLRTRLLEICEALLNLETTDSLAVMGSPDNRKLRSSMTLFSIADSTCSTFQDVLDKFYIGKPDARTLKILQSSET